jgi:hypothetical protein
MILDTRTKGLWLKSALVLDRSKETVNHANTQLECPNWQLMNNDLRTCALTGWWSAVAASYKYIYRQICLHFGKSYQDRRSFSYRKGRDIVADYYLSKATSLIHADKK